MELHNQLGKTAKPHPQNERTGTFPLDNFWTIPALMETQQGYEAPPPPAPGTEVKTRSLL